MTQRDRIAKVGVNLSIEPADQLLTASAVSLNLNQWAFCELDVKFRCACVFNVVPGKRKWLSQFSVCDSALFCVDLASYDINHSSIKVLRHLRHELQTLLSSKELRQADFLVLFTNKRRFKKKIAAGIPLNICFKDAPPEMDARKSLSFVKKRFAKGLKRQDKERVHFMECDVTEPEQMLAVFAQLKELLHHTEVEDLGLGF